jgi:hypothetical protein
VTVPSAPIVSIARAAMGAAVSQKKRRPSRSTNSTNSKDPAIPQLCEITVIAKGLTVPRLLMKTVAYTFMNAWPLASAKKFPRSATDVRYCKKTH